MKLAKALLSTAFLLSLGATEANTKSVKSAKGAKSAEKSGKATKGGKAAKSNFVDTPPVIGEAEMFFDSYDFMRVESPESIVFDSKGNAYVSLTINAFISVINPEGEEIARIDMPQGDCRPQSPFEISFPVNSLQFGTAMSKDDTLYVVLLACAEGFPHPPIPNPNTGLWMINTEDYSMKQVARIPNANGRARQEECCEWNEAHYSNADPPYIGQNPDGSCNPEECAFYEAWYGSAAFQNVDQFTGYAELWNGIEVVGDCVYITNSYFHEVWRACPSETEDEMWGTELWMGNDVSEHLSRVPGTNFQVAGFNGIKYFEGALYVANTSQGKILKVPMLPAADNTMTTKSGKEPSIQSIIRATGGRGVIHGTPELVFEGGDADEFTFDSKGNIYTALFEGNKVLKIFPNGTSTTLLDGGESQTDNCPPPFGNGVYNADYDPIPTVDLPTSVAFGTNGETNEMTLYVANSAFIFYKSCAGFPILMPDGNSTYYPAYPGISRIFVGETGAKQIW